MIEKRKNTPFDRFHNRAYEKWDSFIFRLKNTENRSMPVKLIFELESAISFYISHCFESVSQQKFSFFNNKSYTRFAFDNAFTDFNTYCDNDYIDKILSIVLDVIDRKIDVEDITTDEMWHIYNDMYRFIERSINAPTGALEQIAINQLAQYNFYANERRYNSSWNKIEEYSLKILAATDEALVPDAYKINAHAIFDIVNDYLVSKIIDEPKYCCGILSYDASMYTTMTLNNAVEETIFKKSEYSHIARDINAVISDASAINRMTSENFKTINDGVISAIEKYFYLPDRYISNHVKYVPLLPCTY